MMRALNRLRRSVALFVCPELGVQASMDPRCSASASLPLTPERARLLPNNPGSRYRPLQEELGVGAMTEPKAEGRYLSGEEKFDLENRIFHAANPWREVQAWLKESRATGWRLPKNGETFVGQMVLLASSMSGQAGEAQAARQPHPERSVFVFDPELRAVLRHRRVERAKKVLKVIQLAEQGRVTEEPDLLFDRAAEDLAVLLFGEA